jgi:hypothetical protein
VIGDPPSDGVLQVTVAWAFPANTLRIVGAPGNVAGVTEFEAGLGLPVPALFVAVTVQAYG